MSPNMNPDPANELDLDLDPVLDMIGIRILLQVRLSRTKMGSGSYSKFFLDLDPVLDWKWIRIQAPYLGKLWYRNSVMGPRCLPPYVCFIRVNGSICFSLMRKRESEVCKKCSEIENLHMYIALYLNPNSIGGGGGAS